MERKKILRSCGKRDPRELIKLVSGDAGRRLGSATLTGEPSSLAKSGAGIDKPWNARQSMRGRVDDSMLTEEELAAIGVLGSELDEEDCLQRREPWRRDVRASQFFDDLSALDGLPMGREEKRSRVLSSLRDLGRQSAGFALDAHASGRPTAEEVWRRLAEDALFERRDEPPMDCGVDGVTAEKAMAAQVCYACGEPSFDLQPCPCGGGRCLACVDSGARCLGCPSAAEHLVDMPCQRRRGQPKEEVQHRCDCGIYGCGAGSRDGGQVERESPKACPTKGQSNEGHESEAFCWKRWLDGRRTLMALLAAALFVALGLLALV